MEKKIITGDEPVTPPNEYSDNYGGVNATGLTIRQYYAGLAMQGLCANSIAGEQHIPENLAREAVEYAEALIIELNK